MKRILSTSEVLDSLMVGGIEYEVLADANALFDEDRHKLEVSLDLFLRPFIPLASEHAPAKPSWLPAPSVQVESVSLEDALPMAQDVFQSWVRRIRRAMASHHSNLNTQAV